QRPEVATLADEVNGGLAKLQTPLDSFARNCDSIRPGAWADADAALAVPLLAGEAPPGTLQGRHRRRTPDIACRAWRARGGGGREDGRVAGRGATAKAGGGRAGRGGL